MNTIAKIALIAMLLLGLGQILVASIFSANIWAACSDFKAHAARLASDANLKPALSLGGENEKDDYFSLMDKMKALTRGCRRIGDMGLLQVAIAVLGLCAAFRKN